MPAEPLRLGHHVGELVLFFHLTLLLSLSESASLLLVAEIDTSSVGFGWCSETAQYQKRSRMSGALCFSKPLLLLSVRVKS